MTTLPENPFRVPHAANLNDSEIESYWVDLGEEGGFQKIFRPSSLMPMIVLGGKGSGKTHLMRHFSFELQQIRSKGENVADLLRKEKYIGIYLRASGLHASRFKREERQSDAWTNLFAFYVELWFTERLCSVVSEILPRGERSDIETPTFLEELMNLFDYPPFAKPQSWDEFVSGLGHVRRNLDLSINNCFTAAPPNTAIVCSRGALIFGLPKLLAASIKNIFGDITFTWLIDEYEHFHETAQKYINTLVREKQRPSSFKIGVRLWGIYTFNTFSNEEVLKKESEYEELHLDERLRSSKAYPRFALSVVKRRLERAGWNGSEEDIKAAFSDEGSEWEDLLCSSASQVKRPWLEKLRKYLNDHGPLNGLSTSEVEDIIASLSFPGNPFIEKLNTFLFYRAWAKKLPLKETAAFIAQNACRFVDGDRGTEHEAASKKFKGDLLAQMRRELQLPVLYTGFDAFVQMSSEVVRSLLVTLKKIYDEALYSGERMFEGKPVSGNAQSRGVAGASEWFFEDVLIYGEEGLRIRAAIERLGRLFRALRFSEKPSECSLNSFSLDPNTLTTDSKRLIDSAVRWSVFIPVEDRLDRNTGMPNRLYRLSGMLCPRFDLPLSSRGNIALSGSEVDALFSTSSEGSAAIAERQFGKVTMERLARCSPPFKLERDAKLRFKLDDNEQSDLFGSL